MLHNGLNLVYYGTLSLLTQKGEGQKISVKWTNMRERGESEGFPDMLRLVP